MDKNSERSLSAAQRKELLRLGREVDDVMVVNSLALARALRPELFDNEGKPLADRFKHALRATGA
jgi:hypothetical protein